MALIKSFTLKTVFLDFECQQILEFFKGLYKNGALNRTPKSHFN